MILKESRKIFCRLGIEIMEGKILVVFHVRLKFPNAKSCSKHSDHNVLGFFFFGVLDCGHN